MSADSSSRPSIDADGVLGLYSADGRHGRPDSQRRPGVQVLGTEAQTARLFSGQVRDQPSSLSIADLALAMYACAPAASHWGKAVLTRRAPFSM